MKQNIITIHLRSNYTRKDGTSQCSENLKKFFADHPNAERYYGDLRKEKTQFKAVYKLFCYEPKAKYANNMYTELYATYIER